MDCIVANILVLVIAYMGENPIRRKHTVFFATLVSEELGDPKSKANNPRQKGSWLIFQPLVGRRGNTRQISDG